MEENNVRSVPTAQLAEDRQGTIVRTLLWISWRSLGFTQPPLLPFNGIPGVVSRLRQLTPSERGNSHGECQVCLCLKPSVDCVGYRRCNGFALVRACPNRRVK